MESLIERETGVLKQFEIDQRNDIGWAMVSRVYRPVTRSGVERKSRLTEAHVVALYVYVSFEPLRC